jgi:hypothetical protein
VECVIAPARIALFVLPLAVVAACTSSKPARVVTVTATQSGSPTAGSSAPTTAASTTPPSSAAPTGARRTKLNGTCDTLLPDDSIYHAIGINTLPGTDAFVVGKPEPDISRIAYLNCRYGVTGTGANATPGIEIGISLYASEGKASARVTSTVDDYSAHGASTAKQTVNGLPATLLTGGVGDGYDVPLLVVASGQRTVAVSVASSVATGDKAVRDATALASLALKRTSG